VKRTVKPCFVAATQEAFIGLLQTSETTQQSGFSASRGAPPAAAVPRKSRGRVDIIREKSGRGGKTVTVVKNFVGIGLPEKEALAKAMQRTCGTGGTVKDGHIEIQGDQREAVARILTQAGFRPVMAGG
jgi:translation initiation factor 1